MTDNLIAFPSGRIPQGTREFLAKLADAMTAAGTWGWTEWQEADGEPASDTLLIGYPGSEFANLTIGRNIDGRYFVMDDQGQTVREGRTLEEALGPWLGMLRTEGKA